MIARRSWIDALVLVPALTAALAVAGSAFHHYGGDLQFLQQQKAQKTIRAADLERVLLTTPEPYGAHRRNATEASCRRSGADRPSTTWHCTVRYRSGRSARMRVTIGGDGSFRADLRGSGAIAGCCVQPGAAR